MAGGQFYEKVADDEAGDSLMGKGPTRRAPPTEPKRTTFLTKIAYVAVAITIFLVTVALVSTVIVSIRLPAATKAALEKQLPKVPVVEITGDQILDDLNKLTVPDTIKEEYHIGSAEAPLVTFNTTSALTECGKTADEARAAGCVFDVMMMDWTPSGCVDKPLTERYLKRGNWTWYANSDASKVYTDEEIRLGNHETVYVQQSYHRHQCVYAWEKVTRAMRNQAPLIEELISYDHVMQCRKNTLALPDGGAVALKPVIKTTGFTKCASYNVWIKDLPFDNYPSTD